MTNMIFWDQLKGPWRRTPQYTETTAGYIDVQAWADKERLNDLAALGIYEEFLETGSAPLGYNDPIVELREGRNRAVRYPTGTDSERNAAQRADYQQQIENQRVNADVRNIDLLRDSGLRVLADEANDLASQKLTELSETDDADLGSFDPVFNPASVGSIAAAASLYVQEQNLLSMEIGLTAAEKTELENVAAQHNAIALGNDDSAAVPAVPLSVRRLVGVAGEDYGLLIATRKFAGGWWSLTFRLETSRQLDTDEYWIAVYDGNDTYLTTPKLTKTDDDVYIADEDAVNLRLNDTNYEYRYTLCHKHITNEQFARVALIANQITASHRVRWGGNTA